MISMRPSEPMGLRLRDVHPECGGGVVVVGFERSAAGKRAGVLQGDRITEVNGKQGKLLSGPPALSIARRDGASALFIHTRYNLHGGFVRQSFLETEKNALRSSCMVRGQVLAPC